MQYNDLHDLIQGSYSSRQYFISLPTNIQAELHRNGQFIHSASQLHSTAEAMQRNSDYISRLETKQ